MARPKRYVPMVAASRDEASLAVRLYNDAAEVRSFEGFVVHMHLAWLYLLHAELTRDGVDFRYRRRDNSRLLERVDGDPKLWELSKCVQKRWDDKDPVRANITFFIGLRNKIEHRYARQQQALTAALGGHAQALLLNYEEELTSQFGVDVSLATRLRFPVFIGSFTDQGEEALRKLRTQLPASLRTFIAQYHDGLDTAVEEDRRFEFRLRVVQELANRDPDALAIQFTKLEDMDDEQRQVVKELGKQGMVIVRERQRDVIGLDLMKPKQVIAEVEKQIPFKVGMGHFVKAWQKLNVRPPGGSDRPWETDERYCVYDKLNRNYGYKPAFVKKLVRELRTEEGFRRFLDDAPVDKETGKRVGPPQWLWRTEAGPDDGEPASA